MTREKERSSRKWKSTGNVEGPESTDESSSTSSPSQPRYIKHTSTPLKSKRLSLADNSQPFRSNVENTETDDSPDVRKRVRSIRTKEHRRNHGLTHSNEEKRNRYNGRRGKRKKEDHPQLEEGKRRKASSSSFSGNRQSTGDASENLGKKANLSQEWEVEVPITEILKRPRGSMQTKYGKPAALPELTTDKIYIQGRDGFNVVKVAATKGVREEKERAGMKRNLGIVEGKCYLPIRAAVVAQKFWKSTGLVYQGVLAGMALMHFIMLYVFFESSLEFMKTYSTISEIYTTIFSFLITLCTVTIFDKFDLARLGMQHVREVYTEQKKSLIAVPLYITIFCLHQFSLKTEDKLALIQFSNLNDSTPENTTNLEPFLQELNTWQKVTVSKELLAVFAWLFVSLGTKEDAFLSHLQSMEKYTNEECSE